MDMPDGWERVRHTNGCWKKGRYCVSGWCDVYLWYEFDAPEEEEHGVFSDPVSCAVACELENGGCTDGHT